MADGVDTGGGTTFSDIMALLGPLLSAGQGIYQGIRSSDAQQAMLNQQKQVYNLQKQAYDKLASQTPQQMASGVSALTQPLSKELIAAVIKAISAQMAASGVSGSPGIIQSAIAQALAGYQIPLMEQASQMLLAQESLPLRAMPQPQTNPTMLQSTAGAGLGAFKPLIDYASSPAGQKFLTGLFGPSTPPPPIIGQTGSNPVTGGFSAGDTGLAGAY